MLLERFQWSDTDYDIDHVKEELADVLVYCRDKPDKLGLDEDEIVLKDKQPGLWVIMPR